MWRRPKYRIVWDETGYGTDYIYGKWRAAYLAAKYEWIEWYHQIESAGYSIEKEKDNG